MTNRIGLPLAPRRVAEITAEPPLKYRAFYDAAVEGRIPAEFVGSRWSIAEVDLPKIATAMGLTVRSAKAASARKAQPASIAA